MTVKEKQDKELNPKQEAEATSKPKEEKKLTPEEQIGELEKQIEDWKNKYYLAFADTENLRKQYEKDQREFIKYRAMGFVDKLLPILDNFHMVLGKEVADPVLKNYLTGFQYIYRQMVEVLDSEGVKEIAPKIGDQFDERKMHAVDTEEHDDIPANQVVHVFTNGYILVDRLVRPAQVRVSKEKAVQQPEQADENKQEKKEEQNLN